MSFNLRYLTGARGTMISLIEITEEQCMMIPYRKDLLLFLKMLK
jgi:hypothetical protein